MPYQIADGFNNAGSLATITPQPAAPDGIRYPELVFYGNGQADFDGALYVDLYWTALTRAQYNTLRTLFGLSDTVASNDVTVRLRTNADSWANYNATAIYLHTERREMYGWSRLSVRLINMAAL